MQVLPNVDTYTCKPKTTNVFNFNKQYRNLNRRKDACTFWPVMYGNAFTAMCLLCRCSDQYQKYKLYTRQFDKHSHLHHTSYLQIHDILSNWKLRIYPPSPAPTKKQQNNKNKPEQKQNVLVRLAIRTFSWNWYFHLIVIKVRCN
jgi:hypothetical protein